MKFSVCIPNFNYAHYLDKTIESVLVQEHADFEILVSDNCSTDASVKVIESYQDPRITVRVNPCNVGFAGNLDRAGAMATGDRMILLSSDDLMGPGALTTYERLLNVLPNQGANSIVGSAQFMIDSQGATIDRMGTLGLPFVLPTERAPELESAVGGPVYRVPAKKLLKRCVMAMQNPFHFATACYPRQLYESLGGYGGGRLYNPDKWFHWRLLGAADEAYFIDEPLFSYRWHTTNQASLQKRNKTLKFLVDEYLNSVELTDDVLAASEMERSAVEQAFVERDIAKHGWAVLARDNAHEARRILRFGQGVYPQHTRRNPKARLLAMALPFGVVAHKIAKMSYSSRNKRLITQITPYSPSE